MAVKSLCVLLLVSLSLPTVFGKNHYFEHYFSKYFNHKSSSTTPSTSSSTSAIPTSESVISSSQDDITDDIQVWSDEEKSSSSEGENQNIFTVNTTFQQNGVQYNDPAQHIFVARVATIVGSVIFVVVVLGCIVCCCPSCCRGTERRGFIIGSRREILPQPVITETSQQTTVVQHIPPEYTEEPVQQFAPQYQQPALSPNYVTVPQGYQYSPMQPQHPYSPVQPPMQYSPHHPGFQNASALQFYNPPEAPPPYEPIPPKYVN